MTAAFASIGTLDYCSATSDQELVFGAPSGIQDGDLLVAVATKGSICAFGPPAGWVELQDASAYNYLAYKVADNESGEGYTFSIDRTYSTAKGAVLRFTGATTTGLAVANLATDSASATVDLPETTVSASGACIIWFGSTLYASTTSSCSREEATERLDDAARVENIDRTLWIWTEEQVAAGTISSETFSLTQSLSYKKATSLVIPSAAAPAAGLLAMRLGNKLGHKLGGVLLGKQR